MRTYLLAVSFLAGGLVVAPSAEAGQPCTTPPKGPVDQLVWFAGCAAEAAEPLVPEVGVGEVDLTWLHNCPGPWGHEERSSVGPVTIVTYECDDPDT